MTALSWFEALVEVENSNLAAEMGLVKSIPPNLAGKPVSHAFRCQWVVDPVSVGMSFNLIIVSSGWSRVLMPWMVRAR